ncbi:MAG: hypothetical protein FD189_1084 [Elusimicrobia bacterium]|nr:MAG: hypothetical protein FD189_1084 [Elusimicrobiota bacterium]
MTEGRALFDAAGKHIGWEPSTIVLNNLWGRVTPCSLCRHPFRAKGSMRTCPACVERVALLVALGRVSRGWARRIVREYLSKTSGGPEAKGEAQ